MTDTDTGASIVSAKQSFRLGTQLVRQGTVYQADDPVVVGREHLFEPVENRVRTTAAIGRPVDDSPPPAVEADDGDEDQADGNDDSDGDAEEGEDAGDGEVERPKGNASRDDWAAYVLAIGGAVEDDDSRDDLIELVGQLEGGD